MKEPELKSSIYIIQTSHKYKASLGYSETVYLSVEKLYILLDQSLSFLGFKL